MTYRNLLKISTALLLAVLVLSLIHIYSEPMPLNSTQRPIFVYLRSKDDHKSCTPAGAKLTNEYTCLLYLSLIHI